MKKKTFSVAYLMRLSPLPKAKWAKANKVTSFYLDVCSFNNFKFKNEPRIALKPPVFITMNEIKRKWHFDIRLIRTVIKRNMLQFVFYFVINMTTFTQLLLFEITNVFLQTLLQTISNMVESIQFYQFRKKNTIQ